MERKFASTLEKKVSKFCQQFGVKRAYHASKFAYYDGSKDITFTVWDYFNDKLLIDFINRKYEADISDWLFVFCLLHEIGHHKTLHLLTEEDRENERVLRALVSVSDLPFNDELYFNLPAEDLADRWALEYLTNHPQECWDFQRRCIKDIFHIYNKKSFKKA